MDWRNLIDWKDKGSDAVGSSSVGDYEVEHGGHSFWAYADGRPIGMYPTMDEAKERCGAIALERSNKL